VNLQSGNHKGAIAEAKIAAAAVELGIPVLKPISEHGRYDLVFEVDGRLFRIQCKWAARRGEVLTVYTGGNYLSPRGYVRSTYTSDEIDAIAAYSGELGCCYLLPIEVVAGQFMVHLRLSAPKNAQRASIHWASQYEFSGAVAQLGRASRWHREGRGFESHQLHSPNGGIEAVGAHEFREHFGWYMERAAGGERFAITRRGKPFARLLPPTDRLGLTVEERAAA
jgi:prevent-host-death family protein